MSENNGIKKYLDASSRSLEWHKNHLQKMRQCRFDTISVHGIYSLQEALDFNQGSIIEPVYMSSSQAFRDADEMEAALSYQIPTWCYSRIANPSIYYLEGVLALLEGYGSGVETSCCLTSSGMSAIASAVDPFLTVDHDNPLRHINFVSPYQLYGGTFQQFAIRKSQERNIKWHKVVHPNNIEEWESKINENTRFLYGELPSNPSQSFFDLKAVVELGHSYGIPVIIDSTVATPALLRPLTYGADIVVQSVTKTLTSSGFGVSGAIISRKNIVSKFGSEEMKKDFATYVKLLPNRDNGPNTSPLNAVLVLNDVRTLRSKVDMFSRSTQKIAKFLEGHKHIEKVEYLGLESHPLHELAKKYLFLVDSEHDEMYGEKVNRYGHLMSFRIIGDALDTRNVFNAMQRIWRATDLGKIKSVATIPAISTHLQQGEEARKMADIPANLIRLGVGGEHPDDIITDLDQAMTVLDGKKVFIEFPEFSAGGASSAKIK